MADRTEPTDDTSVRHLDGGDSQSEPSLGQEEIAYTDAEGEEDADIATTTREVEAVLHADPSSLPPPYRGDVIESARPGDLPAGSTPPPDPDHPEVEHDPRQEEIERLRNEAEGEPLFEGGGRWREPPEFEMP